MAGAGREGYPVSMNTASCRILAVDDDPGALKLVRRVVEGMGHRVEAASSRAEASARLHGESFDALLTDVRMESSDAGVRLAAEAHVLRPDLAIVLMTGRLEMETALPALRNGACDYLPKPFGLDDLRAAVERALSSHGGQTAPGDALHSELSAAYEELQKVERTREGMLAIISHELRTPMCTAELAARQLESEPCSSEGETARRILRGSLARLDDAIQAIILHARLSGGKPLSPLADVDFEEVVRGQVRAQGPAAAALEQEIEVAVTGPARPVRGDRSLLATAVRHLLSNALRFNRPGGRARIGLEFRPQEAVLTVADDGEGIPAAVQSRIFDPYYQAADYLTRRVGGLGLGLAIVRRVFEGHGGGVSVNSKPGEGSVFRAWAPLS